jgi:Zn-dependent protease
MWFNGTIQLIRIFKIPVKIHWSFALLLIYIGYAGFSQDLGWQGTLWYSLFVLCLFTCVVMHEYGHALTARRFGVDTVDIILLPIGGVARLTRLPKKPIQELLIALAGPLVNVIIAVILALFLWFTRDNPFEIIGNDATIYTHSSNFIPLLFLLNITLVVFNMIPAFPMDGGRVLRALLTLKAGRLKATRVASVIGQLMAVAFGAFAVIEGQWTLGLIGIFIFFSARSEYQAVKSDFMLHQGKAADMMQRKFKLIPITLSPNKLEEYLQADIEPYYLVTDENGSICGILSTESFRLLQSDRDHEILSLHPIISTHFISVDIHTPVYEILRLFKVHHYILLPVYDGDKLVGVLDYRNFS